MCREKTIPIPASLECHVSGPSLDQFHVDIVHIAWLDATKSPHQRSRAESLSKKTADSFREDHSKASLVFTAFPTPISYSYFIEQIQEKGEKGEKREKAENSIHLFL